MKDGLKQVSLTVLLATSLLLGAQEKTRVPFDQRGKWNLSWGYNRTWYAASDLHLHGPQFDLYLYQVKAVDRPESFTLEGYVNPSKISIPQNNYRLGYAFTKNWSVSIGFDHMKYVMVQDQVIQVSGIISPGISQKYAGSYLDTSVTLDRNFLRYEHTNGFNLFSLDVEYTLKLVHLFNDKVGLYWQNAAGVAGLLLKTDINILGYGRDNDFHFAGYALSLRSGPEIRFLKHFFLQSQLRAGHSILPDILINNKAPERADQQISFLELYVVAGGYFRLWK